MQIEKRIQLRLVAYLIALATSVAGVLSIGYFTGAELITKVYGVVASFGHFFVLFWILLGLPLALVALLSKNRRLLIIVASILLAVGATVFVADQMVYAQYRFHINAAMIDLFLNAGDTISFSLEMWLQIAGVIVGIALFCMLIVYGASRISFKWPYSHKITVLFLGVFLVAELTYMVSFATYKIDLIVVKNYIPLFQPLTANQFLKKIGIKSKESAVGVASSKKRLNYPLDEPVFNVKAAGKKNIIFILADSLRADVLTPEVMPKTWAWAQNEIILKNHYSSSNGTRSGIFGLFYSLPPNYWHAVLTTRTPPVFITALQKQGYDIQAFATATLDHPEFTDTVFTTVRPIRIGSTGRSPAGGDVESVEDFESFLLKRKNSNNSQPFFAFIFLDATHGYNHPKEFNQFQPAWDNPKYMKLTNETDPTPMMNLYKNSAMWTDALFDRILNAISESNLMENSIILVSSDHGQEINDSKKNFWGHNSAYNDAQTKIPGILHWPGRGPYCEENWTISYDIPTTILIEELGMTSKSDSVGVGVDLFRENLSNRQWFLMGGYSDVAIREKNRIIEIDEMGVLRFYDEKYNEHSNKQRSQNIFDALNLMSRFMKR